jgi:hypothetical protein
MELVRTKCPELEEWKVNRRIKVGIFSGNIFSQHGLKLFKFGVVLGKENSLLRVLTNIPKMLTEF